jgi:glycosyltransferase involved in cell wall biosynthesis
MVARIVAALRDLDPPAGGAEMSLATLLKGVCDAGPLAENAPNYQPLVEGPSNEGIEIEAGWQAFAFHTSNRGPSTDLTDGSSLRINTCNLKIEGLLSGAAWRLRDKKTGKPHLGLQRKHLLRRNKQFRRWIAPLLGEMKAEADAAGEPLVGVTQLDWAPGASAAFRELSIPYVCFVRDEIQFRHPDLFRECLENAAGVCCAGVGLIEQVREKFAIKHGFHVPLPVDFTARFGDAATVATQREKGMAARAEANDENTPRIAIVTPSPEKGLAFYHRLLPKLAEDWPEAIVEIYGGGGHVEALSRHPNAECHGFTPISKVFDHVDVHLLVFESTGSWGRVTNEGGLYGVPTVCVDLGAQPEAVGLGGINLPYDAPLEQWVAALREVYDRRDEYGAAARKHVGVIDHRRSISMFRSAIHQVAE